MIIEVSPTANVVLDGSGNGQVFLGPPTGTKWALRLATLQTSTATKHPNGFLYRGSSSGPLQLVDSTKTGDAASSGKIAGPVYFAGQGVWAKWVGGDPGATATLQLFGQQGGRTDPLSPSPLAEGFANQIALVAQSLQLGGDGTAGNPGITFGVQPPPSDLVAYYAGLADPLTLIAGTTVIFYDGQSAADYSYESLAVESTGGTPAVFLVFGTRLSGTVSERERQTVNPGGAAGNPDRILSPFIGLLIKGLVQIQQGVSTTDALELFVTGDTNNRLAVRADGQMTWGPGNAAGDVSLSRFVAGRLQLGADDALDFFASVAGNVGNAAVRSGVTGEANARWFMEYGGKMHWGPGGGTSQDTILYRNGAARLAADIILANVSGAGESWHAVTGGIGYGTNWADFGGTVQTVRYRLMPDGTVSLSGAAKTTANVTQPTTLFTLPAGYRPTAEEIFPAGVVVSGSTISCMPSGAVVLSNMGGPVAVPILGLSHVRFPLSTL